MDLGLFIQLVILVDCLMVKRRSWNRIAHFDLIKRKTGVLNTQYINITLKEEQVVAYWVYIYNETNGCNVFWFTEIIINFSENALHEDGESMFLRNVCIYVRVHAALQLRTITSSMTCRHCTLMPSNDILSEPPVTYLCRLVSWTLWYVTVTHGHLR
jgi:hypothetical protein